MYIFLLLSNQTELRQQYQRLLILICFRIVNLILELQPTVLLILFIYFQVECPIKTRHQIFFSNLASVCCGVVFFLSSVFLALWTQLFRRAIHCAAHRTVLLPISTSTRFLFSSQIGTPPVERGELNSQLAKEDQTGMSHHLKIRSSN